MYPGLSALGTRRSQKAASPKYIYLPGLPALGTYTYLGLPALQTFMYLGLPALGSKGLQIIDSECQVNVKSQSELDIGGRETCHLSRDSSATKIPQKYFLKLQFAFETFSNS